MNDTMKMLVQWEIASYNNVGGLVQLYLLVMSDNLFYYFYWKLNMVVWFARACD